MVHKTLFQTTALTTQEISKSMYTAFNLLPDQRPSQRERMRMIIAIGDTGEVCVGTVRSEKEN